MDITPQNIAKYLDFANHKEDATRADIEKLCQSVLQYGFNSAFVNPYYVRYAKSLIGDKAKVGTVVSFPLGQDTSDMKVLLAVRAVQDGADEIDVSANCGMLKGGLVDEYFQEMVNIVQAARKENPKIVIKFIIETALLTRDEIKQASLLVVKSGASFVKTSSGSGAKPTIEHVETIKEAIGDQLPIKVAGGVHDFETAKAFINAGASRIGTSSAIEIVTDTSSKKQEVRSKENTE